VKTKHGNFFETILDKMFTPKRLMLYAGYVSFENNGVMEKIKGKHEPIISLEVAKAIYKKLNGDGNTSVKIRKDFDERLLLR